jgi:hypothetical protein
MTESDQDQDPHDCDSLDLDTPGNQMRTVSKKVV